MAGMENITAYTSKMTNIYLYVINPAGVNYEKIKSNFYK